MSFFADKGRGSFATTSVVEELGSFESVMSDSDLVDSWPASAGADVFSDPSSVASTVDSGVEPCSPPFIVSDTPVSVLVGGDSSPAGFFAELGLDSISWVVSSAELAPSHMADVGLDPRLAFESFSSSCLSSDSEAQQLAELASSLFERLDFAEPGLDSTSSFSSVVETALPIFADGGLDTLPSAFAVKATSLFPDTGLDPSLPFFAEQGLDRIALLFAEQGRDSLSLLFTSVENTGSSGCDPSSLFFAESGRDAEESSFANVGLDPEIGRISGEFAEVGLGH